MKMRGRSSTPNMSMPMDSEGAADYTDANESDEGESSTAGLKRNLTARRTMDPGHGKTPGKMKRSGRKMKGAKPSFAMRSFGGQLGGGSTGGHHATTAPPVMNRKTHGAPGTGRV